MGFLEYSFLTTERVVMNKKLLPIVLALATNYCWGISVVYNMRILQSTSKQVAQLPNLRPSIGSLVFIDQMHNRRCINDHQHFAALLGSYVYTSRPFYVRADVAFGHIHNNIENVKRSRTQSDDIYLAAGYSEYITERSTVTTSVILGLPTHRDTILETLALGTGHVGMGAQLDGIFAVRSDMPQIILTAARFIHFIPRNVYTTITGTRLNYFLDIGNLVDLFVAYQVGVGSQAQHRIMVGYNPQFLFGAHISPPLPAVDGFSSTAIRSNFFATYMHLFLIKEHISGLILGLSSGFDHIPQYLGIKNQVTAWVGWGINF